MLCMIKCQLKSVIFMSCHVKILESLISILGILRNIDSV